MLNLELTTFRLLEGGAHFSSDAPSHAVTTQRASKSRFSI